MPAKPIALRAGTDSMTAPDRRAALSASADEVPSPCVSVCVIDPAKEYCLGCYRTLDEIAAWINLDSTRRLAVWDAIDERRKAADADPHS